MEVNTKKNPPYNSYEEINEALKKMAVLLLTADRIETKMNEEIIKIKEKYKADIVGCKQNIADLEKGITTYCLIHKNDFSKKRSRALTFGRLGFRTGGAALKTISKLWTWDRVKEKAEEIFGSKYVVVKTTLDKKKILTDYNSKRLNDEQLEVIGCRSKKEEQFFIEIFSEKIKLEDNE